MIQPRARELADQTRRALGQVHPSVLFGAGVAWDWATLSIESWLDNGLLLTAFAALFAIFVLELRIEAGRTVPRWAADHPNRLHLAEQFVLGALLSAFWVHIMTALYPGPAALTATALIGLAVANESNLGALRAGLARAVLITFCAFQLLSLGIPLVTRQLVWIGIPIAGAVGICAAMLALARLGRTEPTDAVSELWAPGAASLLCSGALVAAIHLGLLPPLPLVLRQGGLARQVAWEAGELQVDRYDVGLLAELGLRTPLVEPDPAHGVSTFTEIYAPEGMELELTHEWQWLDPDDDAWKSSDTIALEVRGGAGWRTWSTKRNLRAGHWRVRVLTRYGQELGRLHFAVP